jgi:colanic acid biosynthesis glycosyl transferase WcaI
MARLIFINRYFFPDHSATSQILSDLTFHLAASGHEVHVIASKQLYDQPDAALPACEIINNVKVHRIASTRFGRAALPGRALDYLSFYHSVRRRLDEIGQPGDIVVAKTDPPLLSVVVAPVVRRRRGRLVNWLQDIYPETAIALGVPLIRGPAGAVLASLRNRSLRQSAATVVVGELMARRIERLGVAPGRILIIANWCDDQTITPVAKPNYPLRQAWHLGGKFVVGYSGNLGRAHDFATVLAAAEQLRRESRIVFLVIGGGKGFDDLARAVKARGLENSFCFQAYQQDVTLPYSLAVPDVHWLSLKPELEGLIVPSKFYGIAAAGKPMVMIGDREGEIGRLVRQHDCGIVVAPGDSTRLADAVKSWSEQPQVLSAMGAHSRQMLDKQFTRRRALDDWSRVIAQLVTVQSNTQWRVPDR